MPNDQQLIERVRQINADITIRPGRADDAQQFVDLMNSQYKRQKSVDYFNWQFLNPACPTGLFVAMAGDALAGCFGVQILRLSTSVNCAFTVDLLIAEPYRNRGLFYLLEVEAAAFAKHHQAVAMAALPNLAGMKAHREEHNRDEQFFDVIQVFTHGFLTTVACMGI